MSQSRWKYWIGEDGLARINKEDMPLPYLPNTKLATNGRGISIGVKMNPEYYEFKAEILRVTGSKDIFVLKKDSEKGEKSDE